MRTATAVLSVAVMGVVCAGCGFLADDVDPDMSLPEAKAYTQSIEREIASALSSSIVDEIRQNEKGTFLRCGGDGAEQWAGGTTVIVTSNPEPIDVTGPIAAVFANRSGFTVSPSEDSGDTVLDLRGEHQAVWVVRYDRDRAEVHISSGSPCIHLPDDVWPGGSY